VLLQTAWAVASSAPGSSGVTVRILFDSGSQLSYVTERLKGQLRLKSVKIEKLHLNTFGTCHYKTQESKDSFLSSISFENGRYEVGLAWKRTQCTVPDHLTLCEVRLKSLLK